MTPDEFRKAGHELIEWIARYQERVATLPVLSQVKPGEVRAKLPACAPDKRVEFAELLGQVESAVMPGITHWQSPNFFAYFPSNASGPAILGDLLSAGLGVQGMLWATSPACTELETHVLDWLAPALGLPEDFLSSGRGGGVIQDTSSSAVLCAIIAAREWKSGGDGNETGAHRGLIGYASEQAHSSVEKAFKAAGLGRINLRLIKTDDRFAMDTVALERQIETDKEAGLTPFFICANVGSTSSMAMDPLRPIGEIAKREGVWFHVDAAMAGTAMLCPEFRPLQDGVELADSYSFNPHKWMMTNFDCCCFWVADRAALIGALSILPDYLKNKASQSGEVIDYRDWQLPLGRRFRSLKLWFVLNHYGLEGLRHHLRRHVALAQSLAKTIAADQRFEICAPPTLNLICFRLRGSDESNEKLLSAVNQSGRAFLSHTKLHGRYVIRISVGQATTEQEHVDALWNLITSLV